MPARFVILHHVLPSGEHWDLMLENNGVLLTWQLPADPTSPLALPMAARRIADHRIAYLDYEGPVSMNRGTVERLEDGFLNIRYISESRYEFEAEGKQYAGVFALEQKHGIDWTLDHLRM